MNAAGYFASENPVISVREGNAAPLAYYRITQGTFFRLEGVASRSEAEGFRALRGMKVELENLDDGARTREDALAFLLKKGERREDIRIF